MNAFLSAVLYIISACSKRKDKYVKATTKLAYVAKEEDWLKTEHRVEHKTTKMTSSNCVKQSNLPSNLSLLLAGVHVKAPSVTR